MNIINSARPRQKSMPSMRFAGAPMFPSSPISSIAPEYSRSSWADGENATVLGPSHGLVVEGPAACCHRGWSRHAHVAAQKHEFAEREHSSSVCDFSPKEPLTGISVGMCPNGNRLRYPEYGDLSFP